VSKDPTPEDLDKLLDAIEGPVDRAASNSDNIDRFTNGGRQARAVLARLDARRGK
jgi:hypothetical protein